MRSRTATIPNEIVNLLRVLPKSFTCIGCESDPLPSGELIEFVEIGVSTWESPFSSVKNFVIAALNPEDILYMALYQSS